MGHLRTAAAALATVAVLARAGSGQTTTTISWASLDMGHGLLGGGGIVLQSVAGQGLCGLSSSRDVRLTAGFLTTRAPGGQATVVDAPGGPPLAWSLEQNTPNPFNPSTTIAFQVPVAGRVAIRVYNALGQQVLTAVDADLAAGRHEVHLDASTLSSGAYCYCLSAAGYRQTRKLLLLR